MIKKTPTRPKEKKRQTSKGKRNKKTPAQLFGFPNCPVDVKP